MNRVQAMRGKRPETAQLRSSGRGGAPGVPPPHDGVRLVAWSGSAGGSAPPRRGAIGGAGGCAGGSAPPRRGAIGGAVGCVDIILSSCDSGLCCNVVSIVSGGPPGVPPPHDGFSPSISHRR